MAQHRREQLERPGQLRPVADQQRVERAHAVARVAVGDGLDVRVGVGVDARGDRHALGQVLGAFRQGDGEDRLRVRPHQLAQAVGDARQRAAQRLASSRFVPSAPAATTTPRAVHAAVAAEPGAGALGRDRVAVGAVGAPSGRMSTTVRSGLIVAPARSASHR